MKVRFLCVGKNSNGFVDEGVGEYAKRIKRYVPFEIIFTKPAKKAKSTDVALIKKQETENLNKYISPADYVILLDERGKKYTSLEFADMIQKKMVSINRDLIFIVGGAVGFSDELYKRSNELLSVSKMTFPHQLVRILFLEQLYRAHTIIKNEPYHNE